MIMPSLIEKLLEGLIPSLPPNFIAMVIKDAIANVYDIEIFPNCFHATIKDTETNQYHKFEISNRKNQIDELCDYFKTKNAIFIGYNNHFYDDLIINYIIEYHNVMINKPYYDICKSLYNMSQLIVNDEEDNNAIAKLSHWKYANHFKSMDILSMLFSRKQRVGLKSMQMTMHYRNVKEYDGDFNSPIPDSKIDEMISYNINDVDSTTELLNRCKEDIDLRLWIENEYGINALSMDSVKFGETYLAKEYCNRTNINYNVLKEMRSPMDNIPLNDVIFPFISFQTPELIAVLDDMRKQVVSSKERKSYDKQFVLSNRRYSVGVGGLHSINSPEIFLPSEDEYIGHADVTSMYPSLLIAYELTPRHLGKNFLSIYEGVYKERVNAKHSGQKNKNLALKLVLNSVTGKMQDVNSWMYDPFNVFKIRINGQLILLMLIERLVKLGCKIVQANTDGVMYIVKKSSRNAVQEAITDVEQITKLTFETGCYEAFYQYAINDYFGIIEGYGISHDPKLIEKKGMFITETNLGKGLSPTIIPKAVINYFVNGIPIVDTIKNCKDIKEFLMGQRVDKKFKVEYNNKFISRINRYYASTNGYYLYKVDDNQNPDAIFFKNAIKKIKYTNMLAKSGVTILNLLDDKPIEERHINYMYYISEAKKIVNALKTVQLELFE